jgi:HlyD family secretion protein
MTNLIRKKKIDMETKKLFVFILITGTVLLLHACGSQQEEQDADRRLRTGTKIVETGELAAIDSRSFVMARYGRYWSMMKVIGILEHGAVVQAGDSIIQLDPTEVKKYIIDRESQLETQQAVLEKYYVDRQNRVQELESRFKNEQAAYNLKKIELESSQFENPRIIKIKELEFEQATISLNKIKKLIEVSKNLEVTTMRIEQIKLQQLKNEIEHAYNILPSLTIRTPISGVFQIAVNSRTGGLVKIGDEIYQGNNMANVPDLTWMKVNTTVNETDYFKLKLGQKVSIRLDAMPEFSFDGEVSYLGKLCRPKDLNSRQKVFDVEVNVLKSDARLKPGMTVSCEFIQD